MSVEDLNLFYIIFSIPFIGTEKETPKRGNMEFHGGL